MLQIYKKNLKFWKKLYWHLEIEQFCNIFNQVKSILLFKNVKAFIEKNLFSSILIYKYINFQPRNCLAKYKLKNITENMFTKFYFRVVKEKQQN